MLRCISATPGSGKTLLMVQMIYEYLNKGYQVYANIAGLKVPGVLPAPYDWRDLPNDSVVFYDEAHEHPAFAKDHGIIRLEDETHADYKRRVNDILDIGNSLSIHRHFGFHIIFATQDPGEQLDSRLFGFFNEHIHLHRAFNASMATQFFWRKVQKNPDTPAVQALCEVKTTWRYPKHLYNFYESSSGEHNHKLKIPLKYIAFAFLPILFIGKAVANMSETGFFGLFGKKEEVKTVPVSTAKPASGNQLTPQNATSGNSFGQSNVEQQQDWRDSEAKRIAMVVKSDNYCRAYDGNGDMMNIKLYDCLYASENPRSLKSAPADKRDYYLQAENYKTVPASSVSVGSSVPVQQQWDRPAEISATHLQNF